MNDSPTPAVTPPDQEDSAKPSGSSNSNTMAAVSYVLGIFTGLPLALTKKKDEHIHFHAVQSVGLSAVYMVLAVAMQFLGALGSLLLGVLGLGMMILSVLLIIKAYNGERYLLPTIGEPIQKFAKQFGL